MLVKIKRLHSLVLQVAQYCLVNKLPIMKNLYRTFMLRKEGEYHRFLINIDYYKHPEIIEEFMLHQEYINKSLQLHSLENLVYLRDKSYLFERCAHLLGRDCIDIEKASSNRINSFFENNPRFVGKENNTAYGSGLKIYENDVLEYDGLINQLKNNGHTILETYIEQHPIISQIYPHSINTIRIHTIRNSKEVKIFGPLKMRFGGEGAIVDMGSSSISYRAIINHEGVITASYKIDRDKKITPTTVHGDTGIYFKDMKIPYIRESIEMVKDAALYFPELRYIGWDIAISQGGPVVVEGNSISGAINTLQMIEYLENGKGLKVELNTLFDFCSDGIFYSNKVCDIFYNLDEKKLNSQELLLINLLKGYFRRGKFNFKNRTDNFNIKIQMIDSCLVILNAENNKIFDYDLKQLDIKNVFEIESTCKDIYEQLVDVIDY